jgi:hypothetical protein
VNAIAGKAGSSRHRVPVTQPYNSQPKRSLFATIGGPWWSASDSKYLEISDSTSEPADEEVDDELEALGRDIINVLLDKF